MIPSITTINFTRVIIKRILLQVMTTVRKENQKLYEKQGVEKRISLLKWEEISEE